MFESTIQNYNLYFNVLIESLEIALCLISVLCMEFFQTSELFFTWIPAMPKWAFLFSKSSMENCWWTEVELAAACPGTAHCLCRSAAICQGRVSKMYLTGLVEMELLPSDHDEPANSTKNMFSWKLPKGKHPLLTPHQKHPDPTQSSAVSFVCWSMKLLKYIYERQSLKNALQSKSMWW